MNEALLKELAPQVLAAVLRRFRDFDAAEDAVQDALVAAAQAWPRGRPDDFEAGVEKKYLLSRVERLEAAPT